ncbi:MAG TPA: DinB family protein [Candidatus Binatia bacterium]|nr:DinB family protein [Candidatus Binatia bacterium]
MPSIDEYARRPREERLARIGRTPDELADAVRGADAAVLARRPAPKSWAATEVICHLRDNEEWFLERMRLIVEMDLPRFVATNPDRWADERQYLTNDAAAALAAFARRRRETLEFLRPLGRDAWARAGVHVDSRGRRTIDEFLSVMAWHDDNHLDQLRRALDGRA